MSTKKRLKTSNLNIKCTNSNNNKILQQRRDTTPPTNCLRTTPKKNTNQAIRAQPKHLPLNKNYAKKRKRPPPLQLPPRGPLDRNTPEKNKKTTNRNTKNGINSQNPIAMKEQTPSKLPQANDPT